MLAAACRELISTEETYVETLRTIVTVFLQPLRTWASEEGGHASEDGITSEEVNELFGSVETLLEVHEEMLQQLREGEHSEETLGLSALLATTMASYASGALRMYAPHVARFPVVCALLKQLLESRARFKAAVRVLELLPASKGLTLQALLVNTVQRLPRYMLLLKEMLSHTDAEAVLDMLSLALDKIKHVTAGVDRKVGDAERRQRAMQICHEVLRRDDLIHPARSLLKEGCVLPPRRAWRRLRRALACPWSGVEHGCVAAAYRDVRLQVPVRHGSPRSPTTQLPLASLAP